MSSHQNSRTPLGLCAMCFTRKPLSHRWAWLKLCADCAAKHGAATPIDATDPAAPAPSDEQVDHGAPRIDREPPADRGDDATGPASRPDL